jgi:hypothetical protein
MTKMKKPQTMKALEDLGRVRLSKNFYMRDFLHSEIAAFYRIPNIPDDPDLVIAAGTRLCEELLEPLHATFGSVAVRSAYRSCEVNGYGNKHGLDCARNEANYAHHIWDRRDADGCIGATACVVVPWFADRYGAGTDWRSLAWWIHDHLPYSTLVFYPKLAAFNIQWHEQPERTIRGTFPPYQGFLTKPGMANHSGGHADWYEGFPKLQR